MTISERLKSVQNKILKLNSSNNVKIIAACKAQPISKIKEVISAGVYNLGVNYVNEFLIQKKEIINPNISWHFIGRIQSNKLNIIVGSFDLIHSVSQLKTLVKIEKIAKEKKMTQKILLQVNLSKEESKSGFMFEELKLVINSTLNYQHTEICGLMTMPPIGEGKKYFKQLKELQLELSGVKDRNNKVNLDYLSMGTSNDYLEAVASGATHVRLGTSLMGERSVE